MKLCYMCADHETREMFPNTELARCEGCGHVSTCWDDKSQPSNKKLFNPQNKKKKQPRVWKVRIRW
jgi:hypothetical protein